MRDLQTGAGIVMMDKLISKEALASGLDALARRKLSRRQFVSGAVAAYGLSLADAMWLSEVAAQGAANQAALNRSLAADYDVVIVGGGTAGCVLAARLSENGARRVLLIEGGGDARDAENVRNPLMWGRNIGSPLDWGYRTVPQEGLGGRVIPYPRGRLLGGSSAINAMIYVRGNPTDFEPWAAAGGATWSYASLATVFEKLEAYNRQAAGRGQTGPFAIGPLPVAHPLRDVSIEAARQAGFRGDAIYSGLSSDVAVMDYAIRDNVRVDAFRAYLAPALARPNLTVLTNAQVVGLSLERSRCAGVMVRTSDGVRTIGVAGTAILAAGAIDTPKILMMAGIGPQDELARVGLPVRSPSPGVGRNLQDHVLYRSVGYRAARPVPPPTLAGGESHAFWRSPQSNAGPDIQLIFGVLPVAVQGLSVGQGYSILPGVVKPKSRGSVRLASADPDAAPIIDPALLKETDDRRALAAGITMAREIGSRPAFADWRAEEVAPGREADLNQSVAAIAATYFHPVGTCAMGPAGVGVVDGALKVHGFDNLRVIDASIMPTIPSGNTMAAVLAIAEVGAALVAG